MRARLYVDHATTTPLDPRVRAAMLPFLGEEFGSPLALHGRGRRLQHFVVVPGATYAWENRRVVDGALMARGTVVAGANGLITIPAFAVSPEGNRLSLLRSP